jgi:hypothetical protein
MRWITWSVQPELAKLIQYYVDTGSSTNILVHRLVEEHPEYPAVEVHKEIERLKLLWLLVYDPAEDWLQVTEWAQDGLRRAFGREGWEDWETGLRRLRERGVFHPDMLQYRIVAKEEVST